MALRNVLDSDYSPSAGRHIGWSIVLVTFLSSGLVDALGSSASAGNYLVPIPRATLQAPGTNAALKTHRNAIGTPCLDFEAISRAHRVNTEIYDNIVSIRNQCSQRIMLSVCYVGSEACVEVEVPAFQRKDAILGVRPRSQFFRYSYKEKF